jgi:predicted nucleic acid-binding protein
LAGADGIPSATRSWESQKLLTHAKLLRQITAVRRVFMPTPLVLDAALDLGSRYSLSMILGACKEAGVTTLYTEDMGAPTILDGVQLVNPFV